MDRRSAILLVSASEKDANMYYATGILTPDPFIYIETAEEKIIVIGNLELERAQTESKADRVLPLAHYWKLAQDKHQRIPSTAEILDILFREFGIERAVVPPDFSLKFADGLRQYGYTVDVKAEPFFEGRVIKTPQEQDFIKNTIKATEEAMRAGIELIRKADIDPSGRLLFNDRPLTSVDVRREIHAVLTRFDCYASHTVVSCGAETTSPHKEGQGVLYAHQPIIIDCSPKSMVHGYYADLTRTVVRGNASDALKRQFETVLSAREYALSLLRPGANGRAVHAAVTRFFEDLGYKTHALNGKPQGFFHATGHGIGIDEHERPHLALRDHPIEAGNVLAIEPALYYDGVGGVRIEDDVLVTSEGAVVLSTLERILEI